MTECIMVKNSIGGGRSHSLYEQFAQICPVGNG